MRDRNSSQKTTLGFNEKIKYGQEKRNAFLIAGICLYIGSFFIPYVIKIHSVGTVFLILGGFMFLLALMSLRCPSCKNVLLYKSKYCPQCGIQLVDKEE